MSDIHDTIKDQVSQNRVVLYMVKDLLQAPV